MRAFSRLITLGGAAAALAAFSAPARAVPAFARKYHTSCLTCHTVFPKLNPFGEAFRRNGFRFPGNDVDEINAKQLPLGQEAQRKLFPKTVIPDFIMAAIPMAFGLTGAATIHPDTGTSGGQADNGAGFTIQNLLEEADIWAAGSMSETVTFWSNVSFAEDGADLESGYVWWNDIVGPKHAVNLRAGKMNPFLSSFGTHSSYLVDLGITAVPVTALFGAQSDSWLPNDAYGTIEANGVLLGRLDYSVGVTSGANVDTRASENVYGHVGFKLGGMSLDDEGHWAPENPMRPWEETALTADGFIYRSVSHFTNANGDTQRDRALATGAALRLQWKSLELDAGVNFQHHTSVLPNGGGADTQTQYDELSYIIFPWLVPAVRFEFLRVDPEGESAVKDFRLIPGVAALFYANLKFNLLANFEWASGAPPAGWDPAGGVAAPSAPGQNVPFEIESLDLALSYAF